MVLRGEEMGHLQAKHARTVDERDDDDGVLVHSIDNPVVPDNQLPIRPTFIFWNLPAGFGEIV